MTTTYRYMTSEEWGMRRTVENPRHEMMPDPYAVLHHEAGNPRHNWDAVAKFRDLNEFSIGKGYWCVAYDILVHEQRLGSDKIITIGEGRGPYMSGATLDFNEESEALCALGYFQSGHTLSAPPSAEMLEGICRGFVYGMHKGWIAKRPTIIGHRDNPEHVNASTCPGDLLYRHLPAIRDRVAQLSMETNVMLAFVDRPVTIKPRLLDTRGDGSTDNYKLAAGRTITVPVNGGIGKTHAKVNLTATAGEGHGHFITWAQDARPLSSNLNWAPGQTICNEITVPLAADGSFQLWSPTRVHVIIDLVGYYQKI